MPWLPDACARLLPDGRLLIEEGLVHLLAGVEGGPSAVRAAHAAALRRARGLEAALGAELPLLARPLGPAMPVLRHPVARRMAEACWPHRAAGLAPIACLDGAIAEHVLEAVVEQPGILCAHLNQQGRVAVHLAAGAGLHLGIGAGAAEGRPEALLALRAGQGVGGVATRGWRAPGGSRGIADAVTVLAGRAADADAAAAVIADAVDVDHPAVLRAPGPDGRPRTVAVRHLPPPLLLLALERGARVAERLLARGLIRGALLRLGEQRVTVGEMGLFPGSHR
ncbi:MAG: UPF0280 family protein [Rhodovarius sp.]|nr:UPF0280 family protein [Rhodovarius sp.]MCX7932690.1 UPF0280 family protein [Rhodovarius sp.]MDW8316016.1 UPF0280 family protein [Rhodovarius sp.]